LAAAAAAGCQPPSSDEDLRVQLQDLRHQNAKLTAEAQKLREALAERDRQVQTLQGLGEARLELLFHVTSIQLGRYTAAADFDGKPGDDGVRVYLSPLDTHNHPLKAAGSVKIQLFDLSRTENNLLAEHFFPVEKISQHWFGAFLSYHYRFDCRWTAGPPKQDEVTVRAVFTDYLTGKQFTTQKVCKVKLPPATQPAG
jgi:hypothetical protein